MGIIRKCPALAWLSMCIRPYKAKGENQSRDMLRKVVCRRVNARDTMGLSGTSGLCVLGRPCIDPRGL